MYLLVIFLPLISGISVLIFGKYIGRIGTSYILVINLFITLLIAILLFYEVAISSNICAINLFK
jgi:hypothetical protein